jgi:Bacterial protein of unknown function (DUF922)
MAGEGRRILGIEDEEFDGDAPITRGGFAEPGPIGLKGGGARFIDRKVANVTNDWTPPSPATTPDIVVGGSTLEQVGNQLNKQGEWGKGGGQITFDPIPAGNSPTVDVNLHGGLVKILPQWLGYSSASAAVKKEWDKMIGKLDAHEQRHVDIAVEVADKLAQDLVGKSIDSIAPMVTAANARMKARQDQMDTASDHGAKAGVPYGDVILDTTIT